MGASEYPRRHGSLAGLTDTDHHTQYVMLITGTLAARPNGPWRAGRLYRATDTGELFLDNGADWAELALATDIVDTNITRTTRQFARLFLAGG